jgi:iron complex outermembrane receptor protein
MDITESFTVGFAVRYEDYDEFGDTLDYKLSGRVDVTDQLAFRATFNTGFRAPTPGQVNTLNTTTSADMFGNLIPSGTYPVNSTEAMVLGSVPLQPEDSTSFTLGAIWQPADNVSITIDYYDISIDDRLALFNTTVTQEQADEMEALGVANAQLLVGGLANDIALTADYEVGSGDVTIDLRHNQNQQKVSGVTPGTINASRVFDLEHQVPNSRSTLTFDYDTGNAFSGYVRLNRYGDWQSTGGLFSAGDASDVTKYSTETLVDIEATYRFNDNFRVSLGAENIFDTEPDTEGDFVLGLLGADTSITSPFGNNGGFWYARLAADF